MGTPAEPGGAGGGSSAGSPVENAGTPGSRRARRQAESRPSRAGRDLPAAVAVGLVLLAVVLLGLLLLPVAFVALVALFCVVGCWECGRALSVAGIDVPAVPLAVGAVGLPFAAHFGGEEAVGFALAATTLLLLVWRVVDGGASLYRSVAGSVFILLWVPFLTSFAILLFNEPGGPLKVATMLLLVVANDTFGYLVGAFLGRHPMAPRISPKKSWEGFAGSVAGAMGVGVLASVFLLDEPWWAGLLLAAATVAAATLGDLSESMVKREVGIKDMSNILPGHGGVMDRLDSVVFASPVAYALSVLLMPGGP